METCAIDKLPVWLSTVGEAYSLTWKNFWEYLKISWCWLLVLPVIFALYLQWFGHYELQVRLEYAEQKTQVDHGYIMDPIVFSATQLKEFILGLPREIIRAFIGASIAVTWHRLILRDEKSTSEQPFRHDKLVWRYFIAALLLAMISSLPVLLGNIISVMTGGVIHNSVLVAVFTIVLLVPSARLSIILPAVALGLSHITLESVGERTRSNFWRIVFGYFLCGLVLIVANILAEPIYHHVGHFLEYVLRTISFYIFGEPLYLTFMSLAFKHFYPEEFQNG